MKSKSIRILLISLFLAPIQVVASDETTPLDQSATVDTTERETKKIQSALRDLNQQLDAIVQTATEPGLGPQLTESRRAFANAEAAFKASDWPATVQESSRFLNLSQKPEVKTYLRAQHMIGRAYEEQGQYQKAIRAYRRYLATFTTNPKSDISDLTDTFERLVRIATKTSEANQSELSKFLSSIASMEYPAEVAAELKYFSAVASSNIGRKNLAAEWLSDVKTDAKNPETKARAKHYKALIAIHKKDWDTASLELESILQMDEISKNSRDTSRLALARVFVKQKKIELSLSAYNQIAESSDAFKDASFEKTLLLAKLGRDDEARKHARSWLTRYPSNPEASHLKGIISWLDLRAGDLTSAKNGIDQASSKLSSIREKLQKDFSGPKLTYLDATRLSNLTNGMAEPSPDLGSFISIFTQLSEMKQRLSEIDGSERSIIYSIANGDLRTFSPAIANRIDQYDRITDQVLSSGAKLVFIERQRLAAVLSEIDKKKLDASQKRREALFQRKSKLARNFQRWATWVGPAEQLVHLSKEWQKISGLEASLNARILSSSKSPGASDAADVNDLKAKIAKIRADLMTSLVAVKKTQAQSIVDQSNIDDMLYIIQQYGTALHEESLIIASYEPKSGKMLDTLDDDDSRTSWGLWRNLVANLHQQVKYVREDASKQLTEILARIDNIRKTRIHLEDDITDLTSVVETYGGENMGMILSHYENELNQRLARQFKWAGDLEYLNYVKVKNDQESAAKKVAIERQILSDSLRENDQGGDSSWQR